MLPVGERGAVEPLRIIAANGNHRPRSQSLFARTARSPCTRTRPLPCPPRVSRHAAFGAEARLGPSFPLRLSQSPRANVQSVQAVRSSSVSCAHSRSCTSRPSSPLALAPLQGASRRASLGGPLACRAMRPERSEPHVRRRLARTLMRSVHDTSCFALIPALSLRWRAYPATPRLLLVPPHGLPLTSFACVPGHSPCRSL